MVAWQDVHRHMSMARAKNINSKGCASAGMDPEGPMDEPVGGLVGGESSQAPGEVQAPVARGGEVC